MTADALIRLIDGQASPTGQARCNSVVDRATATTPSEEVDQLRAALVSNRRISMAMGILMCDQDVDEDQAFACLRRISQNSNRKLHDVAEDVIEQRCLPWIERAERPHV